MKDISALKKEKKDLMLEAAQRWQEEKIQSATQGPIEELRKKQMSAVRERNFDVREANRALLGRSIPPGFGFTEKLIGTTNDLRTVPPNETAQKAGRPVARLHEYVKDRVPEGFGTGFMISSDLLMTNFHVFSTEQEADGCAANFFYEFDRDGLRPGITYLLNSKRFFINDKELDFAVVAVEPQPILGQGGVSDIGFITLIETTGKVKIGAPINIIQYPLGGPKQYAYAENTVSAINDEKGLIRYTTDTESASSGSPAFNEFYEVAALHHMGIPVVVNGKIMTVTNEEWDGEDEKDVKWLANEGISISRIVARLKEFEIDDPEKRRLLNELIGTTGDPLMEEKNTVPVAPKANYGGTAAMATNGQFVFNFYGNTTININSLPSQENYIDKTASTNGTAPLALPEAKIRFDENYDDRSNKGFKTNFLSGFKIDLPIADQTRSNEMLKESGKDLILKYYHYSLAMNEDRRMAMWTAVNVDYSRVTKLSRKALGTDEWRSDPRIGATLQITRSELYDPAKNIDLGHIVRRNDSAWGDSDKESEFGNSDTFHYTNCTPQHEAFNRTNPPKSEGYEGIHGIWGRLEDQIQSQLKLTDSRASIMAGPVLDNDSDPSEDFGLGEIQYPMKFWKVICVVDDNIGPLSYGFLLDQTDVVEQFGLGVEKLDFKSFKKQQIAIREITKLTGVNFDDAVYKADVLKNNFNEGAAPVLSYENVEDIQIFPKEVEA